MDLIMIESCHIIMVKIRLCTHYKFKMKYSLRLLSNVSYIIGNGIRDGGSMRMYIYRERKKRCRSVAKLMWKANLIFFKANKKLTLVISNVSF